MGFLSRLMGKETPSEKKPEAPPMQNVISGGEDDLEIVACIAAAAFYLLDTTNVRAIITRCEDNRPLTWSFAGRQDIMNAKLFMNM